MFKSRIDALADGIFAIVMTLIVIEIKVPHLKGEVTNEKLWEAVVDYAPALFAYALSFIILYTLWRAHSIAITYFAKTHNNNLVALNGAFLLSIAIIPFATLLMGEYPYLQLPVVLYATNVIISTLLMTAISQYVINHKDIENNREFNPQLKRNIIIRGLFPIVSAVLAIGVSFINPQWSIGLFLFSAIIAFAAGWIDLFDRIVGIKWDEKGVRVK
jgi:uncharacterized membrane protein